MDIDMNWRGKAEYAIVAVGVALPSVALVSAELLLSRDSVVEKCRFMVFLLFSVSTYLIALVNVLPFIGLTESYKRLEGMNKGLTRTAGIVGWGAAVIVVLAASLYTNIAFSVAVVRGGPGTSTASIAYIFYLAYAVLGGIAAFLVTFAASYLFVRGRPIRK
jgi:hypothetical protein